MQYKIQFKGSAKLDILEAVNYYNSKQKGLGKYFYSKIKEAIKELQLNPQFQIRYKGFRCLPIKKFPYMIHFDIDEVEKMINVYAVLNTFLNPKKYWI